VKITITINLNQKDEVRLNKVKEWLKGMKLPIEVKVVKETAE